MKKILKKQKGISITEAIVAISITLAISSIVIHFIFNSWSNNTILTTRALIKDKTQMAINRISRHISRSKRLFDNTTVGNNYLSKIDTQDSSYRQPINSSVLPNIDAIGSLSPSKINDPDNPFNPNNSGNCLLFAEFIGSINREFPDSLSPKPIFDIYQFTYYYLSKDTKGMDKESRYFMVGTNKYHCIDLIEWISVKYIDYTQLKNYLENETDNGKKTTVLNTLKNNGIEGAWDKSCNTPNDAFFNIDNTASGLPSKKASDYKIPKSLQGNVLGLGKDEVTYTIAYNSHPTDFPIDIPVPLFPTPNPSSSPTPDPRKSYSDKFPNGFEVMIVGPNSGRSVYTRLTVVGKPPKSTFISQSFSLITYARDL